MNIDNIIADIQYINKVTATLVPVITDQVKTAESVLGTGNGTQKLQFVLAAVQAIYTAANGPVPFARIISVVTAIVNAAVDFYNGIAAFSKTKQQAAA
jgi:hypothetical protein